MGQRGASILTGVKRAPLVNLTYVTLCLQSLSEIPPHLSHAHWHPLGFHEPLTVLMSSAQLVIVLQLHLPHTCVLPYLHLFSPDAPSEHTSICLRLCSAGPSYCISPVGSLHTSQGTHVLMLEPGGPVRTLGSQTTLPVLPPFSPCLANSSCQKCRPIHMPLGLLLTCRPALHSRRYFQSSTFMEDILS